MILWLLINVIYIIFIGLLEFSARNKLTATGLFIVRIIYIIFNIYINIQVYCNVFKQ